MGEQEWRQVPVGPDAPRWVTRGEFKTVLVAAHTLVSTQRLMDVVGLVETDHRVQLVFTRAPAALGAGVAEYLNSVGALEIPWAQAVHEKFDLVLAAAHAGLDQLHGPVMVLQHGAARGKRSGGTGQVVGLDTGRLLFDGRPVPATLVLSHDTDLDTLAAQCPQALDIALVAGDPCYDRMVASLPLRADYRAALGIGPGRELVVIASTWGRHSLFGRLERYLPAVLKQLDPARYAVAMMLHPGAWAAHGNRQVKAWLSGARAAGLRLVEPHLDWRAAIIAADHVIGDHGSTTTYAAALGRPVLCTDLPIGELNPASPQALLGIAAPRLVRGRPIEAQFRQAQAWLRSLPDGGIAARLTSRPGQAHRLLRREMYRLLELSMPGRHRAPEPIPLPEPGW
jgi:hypothetical protein